MKKILSLSLVFILIACTLILSGCGSDPSKVIRVFNASEYIGEDVIEKFEQETGYKVVYSEFASNEDMYTKIKTTSYDVLIPSDYMIDRLIREDLVQPLDFNNIPNYQYVNETFKNPYYDQDNKYSVPYMWSTVGILYDGNKVKDEVNDMSIMWNEKYKGKIFMLDSVRDSIGMTLKKLGYSVNSSADAELESAKSELLTQRPLVLGYVTDEVKDKIISGEGYMGLVYSGEAGKAISEKDSLKYAIPENGTIYCVDAMVVPKNAQNKVGAESFINYMHKPEIAAQNALETFYGCTNTEGLKLLPDEIKNNKGLYPDDVVLKKSEMLVSDDKINQKYLEIWNEIMASN